ncbi:MAG: glycosyltransferase family 2 protein [Candidatus Sumerlaeota bacterium]
MVKIDFVIPVFNEQESLLDFHRMLLATELPEGYCCRYIYINDGSTDDTRNILDRLAKGDPKVVTFAFSRNFGHQAALTAGLDGASGDVVIMMDGDGQHPPSLVPEMLRLYESGCDVVQAQRLTEAGAGGFFKQLSSRMFYRLLRAVGGDDLVEGASDFRLLSRRAIDALRSMPEYERFVRGMSAWIGFTSATVPYRVSERIGGNSKYSLRKMIRLAGDGLFSFSLVPLRVALFLAAGFVLVALAEVLYIAGVVLGGHGDRLVPGWSSIILILTVSSAVQMILLGILGVYVGIIFREVKRRPIYIVQSKTGDSSGR